MPMMVLQERNQTTTMTTPPPRRATRTQRQRQTGEQQTRIARRQRQSWRAQARMGEDDTAEVDAAAAANIGHTTPPEELLFSSCVFLLKQSSAVKCMLRFVCVVTK